jgi:signal transduction histidine kinase/DNA-binding response OmpR family regulator
MQPLVYLVEGLFLILFLATLREYLRRRDPVSRDLALVFSALAVLFVVQAWGQLAGPAPAIATVLGGALLLLQPVFTLHLVSLVRSVPRWVLAGSLAATILAAIGAVLFARTSAAFGLVAIAVFVAIETTAAIYLLLAAVRREGPVAARMGLAAISTGIFALALFGAVLGSVAAAPPELSRATAAILALAAGIGYLLAFLTPGPMRRVWQASATVEYTRQLIARSSEPVSAIWAGFADMAARMQGGSAVMITGTRPAAAGIVAAAGVDAPIDQVPVAWDDLEALLEFGTARWDMPADQVGPLARHLAELSGARFVSIVPIAVPQSHETAALVLLSSHRALFQASDFELLGALGSQTAVVAERRAVMAEHEALADRLSSTVEALRSASAAKSDFVASMSHEFRTPLSAIIGFSDLMTTEPRTGDLVTVPMEWVSHIQRGGQHLLALVNDVLDLARVEAGRLDLHPEPIDVGHAVTEAVNGLQPLADRKRLAIGVNVSPLTVAADRGRFRQILYNLVSNAIKYTPERGSILVSGFREGGDVRIAVSDSGVGIAAEDHGRVFEEFRQVGDPAERQPGSGLGLAVTKRLAEAHGGRIELVSARGQGSTFTLVLPETGPVAVVADPWAPGPAPATASPVAAAAVALPPDAVDIAVAGLAGDILVIEDDPSAVRLLREYLEGAGYRIRMASDGEAGIAAVLLQRPAAIVLDVLLPGIDGWEVLRRLKADPRAHDIPVVFVTVVEEREVGLALGAVDYLVKPIHREALLACLERYVPASIGTALARRVLVVDDEPAALALIRGALEPEGVDVVIAHGGREALEWARVGELVDMIVCDLVMPDVDGFEVIAALKGNTRTASVPIVVCTAHDLTSDQKDRLNGNILGIVAKGQDARVGLLDWLAHAATPAAP